MIGVGSCGGKAIFEPLFSICQGVFLSEGLRFREPALHRRALQIGFTVRYGVDIVRQSLSAAIENHLLEVMNVVRRRGAVRKFTENHGPVNASTIRSLLAKCCGRD